VASPSDDLAFQLQALGQTLEVLHQMQQYPDLKRCLVESEKLLSPMKLPQMRDFGKRRAECSLARARYDACHGNPDSLKLYQHVISELEVLHHAGMDVASCLLEARCQYAATALRRFGHPCLSLGVMEDAAHDCRQLQKMGATTAPWKNRIVLLQVESLLHVDPERALRVLAVLRPDELTPCQSGEILHLASQLQKKMNGSLTTPLDRSAFRPMLIALARNVRETGTKDPTAQLWWELLSPETRFATGQEMHSRLEALPGKHPVTELVSICQKHQQGQHQAEDRIYGSKRSPRDQLSLSLYEATIKPPEPAIAQALLMVPYDPLDSQVHWLRYEVAEQAKLPWHQSLTGPVSVEANGFRAFSPMLVSRHVVPSR
jgi:hypothetical protein